MITGIKNYGVVASRSNILEHIFSYTFLLLHCYIGIIHVLSLDTLQDTHNDGLMGVYNFGAFGPGLALCILSHIPLIGN